MNTSALPPQHNLRASLHNELHARPPARIRLPALVTYVALLNKHVSREKEWEHLRALPGHEALPQEALTSNFLRLRSEGYTVKWERHTEFTRYSIVQPLPPGTGLGAHKPDLVSHLATPPGWLARCPGLTIAAIQLVMIQDELQDPAGMMGQARHWLGRRTVLASRTGGGEGHSWVMTDLHIGDDGFERMLVLALPGNSEARMGRISMRLLELETYRLMALRGLPVAKALAAKLSEAESELADITSQLDLAEVTEQVLLDRLISLAARVERCTALHSYRFAATRAYDALVQQRIAELREKAVPGGQTLGEFVRRRMSPAIATVASTAQRLTSLSERVARTSALLRTRVDIATEGQNQLLLEKLTRGQELQLRLQTTVEGLSIAAISYYVISLLLYAGKAVKALGVPIHPEMFAGGLIPLVLWGVWRTTRRIHEKLHASH